MECLDWYACVYYLPRGSILSLLHFLIILLWLLQQVTSVLVSVDTLNQSLSQQVNSLQANVVMVREQYMYPLHC